MQTFATTPKSELAFCLDYMWADDVLIVLYTDRLGRWVHELLTLIEGLEKRDAGQISLNSPLAPTTSARRAFLWIHTAFVEKV